jgi:hypothetical protein
MHLDFPRKSFSADSGSAVSGRASVCSPRSRRKRHIVPGERTAFAVEDAGTYTFRLVDSLSERHIVQIFNQTGTQLIATLLTVADQRLSPPDDTVIMFGEAAGNAPRPITRWFYPGDTVGEEFVYPKSSPAMTSMP